MKLKKYNPFKLYKKIYYSEYEKLQYISSFKEYQEIYDFISNRIEGDTIQKSDYIDFLIDWYEYNHSKKKRNKND